MRIAVVSDIHGNWAALETVLRDIEKREVDQIICAGDFIDPMPSSRRVFDYFMEQEIVTLRGNHEDYVVWASEDPKHKMNTHVQFRPVQVTASSFDTTRIGKLKSLPLSYVVTSKKAGDLFICHASPKSNSRGWRYEITPELENEILSVEAKTLVCGHWHDAETRAWKNRTLIAAGSVGVPLSGKLEAEYLLLTEVDGGWDASHLRVPYDPTSTLEEYKREDWVKKGGPVGWMLFYEVLTANRAISPFLKWLNAKGPLPVDEKSWEAEAQAYLQQVGSWDLIRPYL